MTTGEAVVPLSPGGIQLLQSCFNVKVGLMLRGLLLLAALWGAAGVSFASPAESLRLCVDYQVAVPSVGRDAMARELILLFPGQRIKMVTDCAADGDIHLTVRDRRPLIPSDVLGLAERHGEGVAPRMEIFLAPMVDTIGPRGWESLGRALARVAGHELVHYLLQRQDHDHEGLFSPHLTHDYLLQEQVRPMLIAARR